MAGVRSGAARGLGMALIMVLLVACGSTVPKTQPLENYTAEDIYKRGELELVGKGNPKDALTYFQEVERLYPYTEWAKRGLIMQAYTLHKTKNYEEARVAAQRYLNFYPGDEDAAYAQYLMALSYYDQIDEVGPRSGSDLPGAASPARGDRAISEQRLRQIGDTEVRPGL